MNLVTKRLVVVSVPALVIVGIILLIGLSRGSFSSLSFESAPPPNVSSSTGRIDTSNSRPSALPDLSVDSITAKHRFDATVVLGYVVDDETGVPLQGVRVGTPQRDVFTYSDNRGFFQYYIPLTSYKSGGFEERADISFEAAGYITNLGKNVIVWPNGDLIYRMRLRKGTGVDITDHTGRP